MNIKVANWQPFLFLPMEDINNQTSYWNSVAWQKNFTHPLNLSLLKQYLDPDARILDYGCGYGRITNEIWMAGFKNVLGVDTSLALIERGLQENPQVRLMQIAESNALPIADNSLDGIILFAVLTCIPENEAQVSLVQLLNHKLRKGGILYVSDYYLQKDSKELKSYATLHDDPENLGVFHLPEGATFRHHSKTWISKLFSHFKILYKEPLQVFTMNGHAADAFQLIGQKV